MTTPFDPARESASAAAALQQGRFEEAAAGFGRVCAHPGADARAFFGLAYARRGLDDWQGALAALDEVLRREPRNIPALILRGDGFVALGDLRAGASFYQSALKLADGASNLPAPLIADLRRVEQACLDISARFAAHLNEGLAARGITSGQTSARFAHALGTLLGETRVYRQQPRYFYYPGLADIGFYPREALPCLDALEAAFPAIREELQALMRAEAAFAPYVETRADRPNTGQAGMAGNDDWSALYLVRDGHEIEQTARACPATMAALGQAPLTRIEDRTPSVLFSRLKGGARIPPHTGLMNTRLICHLPLIVPEGCAFRVGHETRPWREGVAWGFDDTIEHEAWNDSTQDRVILIFDVWKPEIGQQERAELTALFETINDFGGGARPWDA